MINNSISIQNASIALQNAGISLQDVRSMIPVEIKQELKQTVFNELNQSVISSCSLEDKLAKEVACSLFGILLDGSQKSDGEVLTKHLMGHIHSSLEAEKIKMQSQLPKKVSGQFDRLYRQKVSQFSKQVERKVNRAVGITQKAISDLEKELTIGIDQISSSLAEAKKHQCHPKDLAQISSKEADRIADQLIEEELQQKAKKSQKRKRRVKQVSSPKATTSLSKDKQKVQDIEPQSSKAASQNLSDEPLSLESKETRCATFLQKLHHPSMRCVELPRVRRWVTEDPEQIRHFTDKSAIGETITHYEHLSVAEVLFQRAMHYLPGTERLWKSRVHREIYTFPTDRGAGVVAQLSYNRQECNGILYFGCDEKYRLFHRYFEEVEFTNLKNNIFLDTKSEAMREKLDLKQTSSQDWMSTEDFQVTMLENGALKFSYSDNHFITVYPLNKELLNRQLNPPTVHC